jgi:hypothetical protein
VVVVLGMHRSGTSLTTGILNALGVTLSEDLMPATQYNAMGYFESVTIAAIHDSLLTALGSSWKGSESLTPFPDHWWTLPAVLGFKRQLLDLVRTETETTPGVWGFKDPRTARLLPLWDQIFKELHLNPRFVLVVRHPREVAKSLFSREMVNPIYAELLWLEHYVDILKFLGARVNAIVDYRRWFSQPIEQATEMIAELGFDVPSQNVLQTVVDRYVAGELRHHDSGGERCLLPYSAELYDALSRGDRKQCEILCELFNVNVAFSRKLLGLFAHRQLSAAG